MNFTHSGPSPDIFFLKESVGNLLLTIMSVNVYWENWSIYKQSDLFKEKVIPLSYGDLY